MLEILSFHLKSKCQYIKEKSVNFKWLQKDMGLKNERKRFLYLSPLQEILKQMGWLCSFTLTNLLGSLYCKCDLIRIRHNAFRRKILLCSLSFYMPFLFSSSFHAYFDYWLIWLWLHTTSLGSNKFHFFMYSVLSVTSLVREKKYCHWHTTTIEKKAGKWTLG